MEIKPTTVLAEYRSLKDYVSNLKPDDVLPGDIKIKEFDRYAVAYWVDDDPTTEDAIVLTANKAPGEMDNFQVAFHESTSFTENGQLAVRRFVDPAASLFRADTVDAATGEPISRQGVATPSLSAREVAFLKAWLPQP